MNCWLWMYFLKSTSRIYILLILFWIGKPFIEVSFSGLLWGYEDELPCLKLDMPGSCQKSSPFGGSSDDGGFGGFGDDDDGFGGFGDDDDDGFGGFGDDDDDDFGGGFGEDGKY